jgi:hypothetical protein
MIEVPQQKKSSVSKPVQRGLSSVTTTSEPAVPMHKDTKDFVAVRAEISLQQQESQARQLRDLFHGRFNELEAKHLIKKFDGNLMAAVTYVFECEPRALNEELAEHKTSWEVVSHTRHKGPESFDTQSNIHELTVRLFACGHCDSFWWKETLTYKPIGQCCFCKTRYDPVPIAEEWGWAEFVCQNCNFRFNGWCQMNHATPCYNCWENVCPLRIVPPPTAITGKKTGKKTKATWMSHHCPTCYGPNCAHPWSRMQKKLPKVLVSSQPHISTGSTIMPLYSPRDTDDITATFDVVSSSRVSSDVDHSDMSTIDQSSPRSASPQKD